MGFWSRLFGRTTTPIAAQATRPPITERGASGVTLMSGILATADYNQALVGDAGLAIWERMFKSDGTARAVERAVTLPIRAAEMGIEPPADDAKSREIAERCEQALREMRRPWENVLWHQLLYLRYGYYLFEVVWKADDGLYVFDDIAPRPPRTIYRWYTDERGAMTGVQQRVWKPGKANFGEVSTGEYAYIDLESERLLHLVNEGEAGNFVGESIARPMYKHWLMADTAERIAAIGVERSELGVPYAKMGPEAQPQDATDVAAALGSLQAQANAYVVFPSTVADMGMFGTEARGQSTGTKDFIEHHKRQMATSYLAEFLALGSGNTGSWALAKDKSSFFLMALKAVADYVADTNTRTLVKRFVDVNYGPQDEYPRMTFSKLERRNVAEYAAAIQMLAGAGALTTERGLEEAIRADLDLPDLPEDVEAEGEKPPAPPPTPFMPRPPTSPTQGEEDQADQEDDQPARSAGPLFRGRRR